jgi:hypothetical protein
LAKYCCSVVSAIENNPGKLKKEKLGRAGPENSTVITLGEKLA